MEGDLNRLLDAIAASTHVRLAGVSTHFANIEDTSDARYATVQFTKFRETADRMRSAGFDPQWIHCANSAATILYPDTHGTLVRPGIAMYGLWPSELTAQAARSHNIACQLSPVLTWKSRVAQVKSVPAGSPIGYGLTEVLKRNSRIAVLPVGYADGFDRKLSSVGEVMIGGSRCRVMGRVCMNMIMVDVSAVPNVTREQEAVLLGRSGRHEITADKLASWIGTINYEVVTRINPTLPRVVV
jgi:alanine racemase